jgi:hypothetical protein
MKDLKYQQEQDLIIGIIVECDWFLTKTQSEFIKYKLQNYETRDKIKLALNQVTIILYFILKKIT